MTNGTTTTTWSLDPVGNITYFHQDVLGNVVALTNHNGALVQQYRYTVWGEPQVFNAANQSRPIAEARSPFLFTARKHDVETGLYHYRARAYSPQIGRLLQFDPIDFGGGRSNVTAYVSNSAIRSSGPLGLVEGAITITGLWSLKDTQLNGEMTTVEFTGVYMHFHADNNVTFFYEAPALVQYICPTTGASLDARSRTRVFESSASLSTLPDRIYIGRGANRSAAERARNVIRAVIRDAVGKRVNHIADEMSRRGRDMTPDVSNTGS